MERQLITVPLGPLQSNMYLITGDSGVFVVDPSVSPVKAESFCDIPGLSEGGCPVKTLLLTHGHHDHIKYVNEWIKAYPSAQVFFSGNDKELLRNGFMNCSYMEGTNITYEFDYTNIAGMHGASVYKDDEIDVRVLETPGHTMGSVCYLFGINGEELLFTGDTVFQGSVGRTDMPGGSSKELVNSVRQISKMDPALKIYPGHGPDSTVGDEIKYNPFFEM